MSRPAKSSRVHEFDRGTARLDPVYHGDLGIVNVDHALAATLVLCALVKTGTKPKGMRSSISHRTHGKATENPCTQSRDLGRDMLVSRRVVKR